MELASKIGQSEKCPARIKGEETANFLRSCRITAFYEKVINVKADVAAVLV